MLLTYRLFSVLLHLPTTPLFSFTATRATKEVEADLGLILKETRFGRTTTELLFAECKTYARFEKKDVDRMRTLSKGFPGAILVFATLRKDLTDGEKKLLQPLVNQGRKYWKAERPYKPVLILTGTELFGVHRPEEAWKRAGASHTPWAAKFQRGYLSLLELCDATQQVYLGTNAWQVWLEERSVLKRARRMA